MTPFWRIRFKDVNSIQVRFSGAGGGGGWAAIGELSPAGGGGDCAQAEPIEAATRETVSANHEGVRMMLGSSYFYG
jgi:hypothetical protein